MDTCGLASKYLDIYERASLISFDSHLVTGTNTSFQYLCLEVKHRK